MRPIVLVVVLLSVACAGPEVATPPETTTSTPVETTTSTQPVTTTAPPVGEEAAPSLTVSIAGFRFSGDEAGSVGDTVQVTNNDNVSHTWTSTDGEFHSGVLGSGETYTFTFEEPGTYSYFCQIHPEMSGSIAIDD